MRALDKDAEQDEPMSHSMLSHTTMLLSMPSVLPFVRRSSWSWSVRRVCAMPAVEQPRQPWQRRDAGHTDDAVSTPSRAFHTITREREGTTARHEKATHKTSI